MPDNSTNSDSIVFKTGIKQLDALLVKGGFYIPRPQGCGENKPDGLIILIRGKTGTGKSTLSLQLAAAVNLQNSAKEQDNELTSDALKKESLKSRGIEPPQVEGDFTSHYYSLEQTETEIIYKYLRLIIVKTVFDFENTLLKELNSVEPSAKQGDWREKIMKGNLISDVVRKLFDASFFKDAEINQKIKGIEDSIHEKHCGIEKKGEAHGYDVSTLIENLVYEMTKLITKNREKGTSKEKRISKNVYIKSFIQRAEDENYYDKSIHRFMYEYADLFTQGPGGGKKAATKSKNTKKEDKEKHRIIIIDGLSILSKSDRDRIEFSNLIDRLRAHSLLGIIIYEPSGLENDILDHQADIVIELEESNCNVHFTLRDSIPYLIHQLHFKKTRFQAAALGWHQYKIREYGMEIYPSTHFQVRQENYIWDHLIKSAYFPIYKYKNEEIPEATTSANKEQKTASDNPGEEDSIIERILGHRVTEGDSVVLLGERGASKADLSLDFLCHHIPDSERGLLISLIDNEFKIHNGLECLYRKISTKCTDDQCENCLKRVFAFYQRPGCISSSEFINVIKERLDIGMERKAPVTRLAFWDLTQIEYRFPLIAADPIFFPALLDLFKTYKYKGVHMPIKSIFIGAANTKFSHAMSTMADNVIYCWMDTEEGANNKSVMLYVDRRSGDMSHTPKKLYALEIKQAGGKPPKADKCVDIRCVEDINKYIEAETMVRKINQLQGLSQGYDNISDKVLRKIIEIIKQNNTPSSRGISVASGRYSGRKSQKE